MNSVQVLGNLTRDPQIRATKAGRAVLSMPGAAAARCGSIFERSGLFPKPAWRNK